MLAISFGISALAPNGSFIRVTFLITWASAIFTYPLILQRVGSIRMRQALTFFRTLLQLCFLVKNVSKSLSEKAERNMSASQSGGKTVVGMGLGFRVPGFLD